jgi:hypothetical protein
MVELFARGRLVELILMIVALEMVALALYWRRTGSGVPLRDLLPNLLAGAFLLLALRFALGDFGWLPCCACLAAAGVAHCVDLARQWRK